MYDYACSDATYYHPSPSNKEYLWLDDDYSHLQWQPYQCPVSSGPLGLYTSYDDIDRNTPSDFTASPLTPLDSLESFHLAPYPSADFINPVHSADALSSLSSIPISASGPPVSDPSFESSSDTSQSSSGSEPNTGYSECKYDYSEAISAPVTGSAKMQMDLDESSSYSNAINDEEYSSPTAYSPYSPHSAYSAFSPLVSVSAQHSDQCRAQEAHGVHHAISSSEHLVQMIRQSDASTLPPPMPFQHMRYSNINTASSDCSPQNLCLLGSDSSNFYSQSLSSPQSSYPHAPLPLLCLPLSSNTIVPSQTQLSRPVNVQPSSSLPIQINVPSISCPGTEPQNPEIEILAPRPTRPSPIAPNALKNLLVAASSANADRKFAKNAATDVTNGVTLSRNRLNASLGLGLVPVSTGTHDIRHMNVGAAGVMDYC